MYIQTNNEPGDEVWVFINNKIQKSKITKLYSYEYGNVIWELDFNIPDVGRSGTTTSGAPPIRPVRIYDNQAFKTKEELVNYLTK